MIIEVKADNVAYITTSTGKIIYIDDSTDELIIDTWDMNGQPIEPLITFTPDFEIKDKPTLQLVKDNKEEDNE
jgi:hypothetical protein|tara:strand:+ start:142 stop:360 length:219 start_codon:yes stop_codon:yes gene_type:complete